MRRLKLFFGFCLCVTIILFGFNAQAQGTVECGSIIEGEFTPGDTRHRYEIELAPGDTISARAEPIGDTLYINIWLEDPSNKRIAAQSFVFGPPDVEITKVVSASGRYTIIPSGRSETIGAYKLYIGCTLRDGTVINPGDEPTSPQPIQPTVVSTAAADFVGFPGLAPVDFSNIARLPLPEGVAIAGAVTSNGGEIIGFTFDANTGDKLDLTFTRISGNLNLGLVVLSADNKVAFQASLVTSESLTTRFTLPSAGQYTIGIFRIDLLPPASPEATAFQVQGTLNP